MSTTIVLLQLLFIQIVIIAPLPFVDQSQQKQDFLYRDTVQAGNAIKVRNALRRDASPSDGLVGSRNASLSLLHIRIARKTHSCVKKNSHTVVSCGNSQVVTVTCKRTSFDCSYTQSAAPGCKKIITYYGECEKHLVTDCKCV